jgi:hypothetical protein
MSTKPKLREEPAGQELQRARPFREVFPDLAANMDRNGVEVVGDPRIGGIPVIIGADIVARFKEQGGEDWELLINLALRKAAGL